MCLRAMDALAKAYWCHRMYKNISWIKFSFESYYLSRLRNYYSLGRMLIILELHSASILSEFSAVSVLWAISYLIPDYSARTTNVIIDGPIGNGFLFSETILSKYRSINSIKHGMYQ
jgi:hypothetical protein